LKEIYFFSMYQRDLMRREGSEGEKKDGCKKG
jgi:hypothetical protein